MPSTSAAWLTDSITGISSKFLYTLSPPFLCSQDFTNRPQAVFSLVRRSYSIFERTRQFLLTALQKFFDFQSSYRNTQVNTQKYYESKSRQALPDGVFGHFKCPKTIRLYPALKSTAWNPPKNRSKSRRFSLKNHRFFIHFFHSGLLYCLCIKNAKVESKIKSTDAQYKYLNFFTINRAVFYINQALILKRFYCSSYTFVTHIALLSHSSYWPITFPFYLFRN